MQVNLSGGSWSPKHEKILWIELIAQLLCYSWSLKVELSQSQRMVFLGEALKKMQPITITIDTIASNKNILVLSPPPPCIQPPFPKCLSKHASDSNVGLRHPQIFAWFKGQGHNWERTKHRNQHVQVPRLEGFLVLMFGFFWGTK